MSKLGPNLHFIGIGGSGMAPLAELAIKLKFRVSGSDLHENTYTQHLKKLGAIISYGQDTADLHDANTVILSSAIKDSNIELQAAKKNKVQVLHRSDFLLYLCQSKHLISVAGTHGKTTSSAMIAYVLHQLGNNNSTIIGGSLLNTNDLCMYGDGHLFVAEIDESDGTILKFSPYIGVLTNIDNDHMDFYKNSDEIKKTFAQYLNNISEDGIAVIGWDNKICRELGNEYDRDKITYGFVIGCDVRAVNYKCESGKTTFTAMVGKDSYNCKLNTFGKHNVMNALCTLATLHALELDVSKAVKALENFPGVFRRSNLIYDSDNLKVYDDYAHNPGKMFACISSLKETYPEYELVVLYQAHRYSRLETMYQDMSSSFEHADAVFVFPVYSAGEPINPKYTPQSMSQDIERYSKTKCIPIAHEDDIIKYVTNIKSKTIFLSLGAGDIYKISHKLRDYFNGQIKKE